MLTSAPGAPYVEPNIKVSGTGLEVVDTFVCLGSVLSRNGALDDEIYARIQKAAVSFGKLKECLVRLWYHHQNQGGSRD